MPPSPSPAATSNVARSGRWQATTVANAPTAVEAYIAGKIRGAGSPAASPTSGSVTGGFDITSTMIGHLFSLHPKHLCLDRCRFAAGAFEALSQEIARSSSLASLSLAGCTGVPPLASIGSDVLHLLWNALLENTTLEALDLSNIQLTEDDATFLADNVIPWNRSIIEWNISGNPDLGDKGVNRIVGALVSAASSVERINLRRCGLSVEGLVNVLLEVRSLTSLQQLDVAMNGGYHQPNVMDVMREVDEILHRNCKLMHPAATLSHTALYDAGAVEMREQSDGTGLIENLKSGTDAAPSSATQPIKRRDSIRVQQLPSPAAKNLERRSSMLLRSPDKHSATGSGSAPSPMRAASFRSGPRNTPPPASSTGASASQISSSAAAASVAMKLPLDAPSHSPAGAPEESSIVDLSAISAGSHSGEPSRRHVDPQSSGSGVVRRSSVAPLPSNASADRSKQRTASPRQQQHVINEHVSKQRHHEVNDGADDWQRVKEHYNSYIRSGNPTSTDGRGCSSSPARASSPSVMRKVALETPKFVLGKLVSKVKSGHPSSAFHPTINGTVMYVREPMPSERRRYAPWNQSSNGTASMFDSPSRRSGTPTRSGADGGAAINGSSPVPHVPSYVGKRVIVLDSKSDPRHQTAIRIVDGGDVTMINDDPRDIGYVSRKLQAGAAVSRPSAGFASNTEREVRWGTDPSNQPARTAQAPPPGTYNVLSPFDASVRKAQQTSRATTATGKKCFGSSGSARSTNVVQENNVPGPGFYEIP
jgi:hypothetical protein